MVDLEFRERVKGTIQHVQKVITESLEAEEGSEFMKDSWTRKDGNGYGQANIIQGGKVFEKGGVNFTELEIPLSASLALSMSERGKNIDKEKLESHKLYAVGVSLVIHPRNPMIPTIHANYRYMEITLEGEKKEWWFAGGSDLTPYYLDEEDCVLFHSCLKEAMDTANPEFYPIYKKECDDYFWIKHRGFSRGVGGVFFDDVNTLDRETLLAMIKSCGESFVSYYPQMVQKHKDEPFTKENRKWQKIRRGHYVEYNLCYDRGTKFGLMTPDANLEAIFMPMPLAAKWEYKYIPEEGSPEHRLLEVLRNPRDWI